MKTLYLIRHAKSSWNIPGLADIDRHLNERGYIDAHAMASRVKKNVQPGILISSPAIRAVSTALIFARHLGVDPNRIQLQPLLYDTSTKQYMHVIEALGDEHAVAFLFGHNPVITETANLLGGIELEDMPTAGIVGIEFEARTWKQAVAGSGKLAFYDFPKNTGA